MTKTVYFVGCGKSKLDVAAPAKDLYQGSLFKKARTYVAHKMIEGDEWYILSAQEGCIRPDKTVEPYDKTLLSMKRDERYSWAMKSIRDFCRHGYYPYYTRQNLRLVFLCGKLYRRDIIMFLSESKHFNDVTIEVPMAGLGIGQQLKWLTDEVSR